jgi:CHAT domain-containing protein
VRVRGSALQKALVMGLSDHGRLGFATREAEVVAQRLGARCVLNEAATAALLHEVAPDCPLVHIAAHGLFRLDAPNFSGIQLADRQLSAIEVFNLNLSAGLGAASSTPVLPRSCPHSGKLTTPAAPN